MPEVGDRFSTYPRWMHESQSGGCLNNIMQKMVTSDCSKMQDSAGSPFLPLSFPIALASFCVCVGDLTKVEPLKSLVFARDVPKYQGLGN